MARVIRGHGVEASLPREALSATARAEALLAEATREAAALREAARREGLAEGHAQAAATLASALEARDALIASARPELVTLSLAIARRVIGEAAEASSELVHALVAEALAPLGADPALTLRVRPEDVAAAEALSASRVVPFRVAADASLGPGDCVVEGSVGRVDARIDTRLEALRGALLKTLGAAP